MQHNFDVEIAQKYGILEAVLLQHIYFWIEKNKANNMHFHDGQYWTYNSNKAFAELFPYATEKQIRTALEKLRKEDILITGNYNKAGFDKTLWYSITEKGYQIIQKRQTNCLSGQMDMTCEANGYDQEGKPIPDIITDNKTDNNICPSKDEQNKPPLKEIELADNFDKIWKLYPRKDGKNTAYRHYKAWLEGKM